MYEDVHPGTVLCALPCPAVWFFLRYLLMATRDEMFTLALEKNVYPALLFGCLRYLLMTVSEEMLTLILEKDVYPARLYGCLWHGHVADRVPLWGHVSGSSNLQNKKQENL